MRNNYFQDYFGGCAFWRRKLMTIHFMCTCGGRTYYLPDNMAGQKVQCPNCKDFIIVPNPSDQVVMARPAED